MRNDRVEHDPKFYILTTDGWPVECEKCGGTTSIWVIDSETRMNLPYCMDCRKVPEKGWSMWEERAQVAADFERKDEAFQNVSISIFDDDLSSCMKEGFTRTIAYRQAVDNDRKFGRRTVSSEYLVLESDTYSFHPTTDQLIDLNKAILPGSTRVL